MMLALAFALLAQQTETMKVRPSTEAEAVAEFEATCVAGLFDMNILHRAVAASRRGYALESDGGDAGWRNWTSPFGSIHYLHGIPETSDMVPKCNLVSFTRTPADRAVLETALRDMAKRQAARGLRQTRDAAGLRWSWFTAAGQPMMAQAVLDRRTPQQIVLTLKPYALASR